MVHGGIFHTEDALLSEMNAINRYIYTVLCYAIPYYTILYYTILYYTILYYTVLYYAIPYYTIIYCTLLYYTILYYVIIVAYYKTDICDYDHIALISEHLSVINIAYYRLLSSCIF